jgi:hypothetical protein
MEGAPKEADRLNIIPITVIGMAGALIVYASFVALQAFYNDEAEKIAMQRNAEGKSYELREFQARQRGEMTDYRMLEKRNRIVALPIERAMKLVVEDVRGGNSSNLVPAVGPHDSPTAPVVISVPLDSPQPAEQPAPGEGTEAEGATPGAAPAGDGAAPAGDGAAVPAGGPPPTGDSAAPARSAAPAVGAAAGQPAGESPDPGDNASP